MQPQEIEPGLTVFACPKSGGFWIPLQPFLDWKEKTSGSRPAAARLLRAGRAGRRGWERATICPESGRLLSRYQVGHGLAFHIEHSPVTGGVWLDKGEWEALKSKGLHFTMNLIFTDSYQPAKVRSSEYAQELKETFRNRIGAADFDKVSEFAGCNAGPPQAPRHLLLPARQHRKKKPNGRRSHGACLKESSENNLSIWEQIRLMIKHEPLN